jgi:hypothetical protein
MRVGKSALHDILDGMTNSCVFLLLFSQCTSALQLISSKRIDSRLRRDRVKQRVDAWKRQTPLSWRQHTFGGSASEIQYPEIGGQEPWID